MLGRNHAMSGFAVGIATLPFAPVHSWPMQTLWVVGIGGTALLPDLDQSNSSASNIWGPPTQALGEVIGWLSGGHRRATHDLVLGTLGFSVLAGLAALTPWSTALVIALAVGLALRAVVIASTHMIGALANFVLSWAGAAWILQWVDDPLTLLPLMVAIGVVVHIMGDWLTTDGVPVPLTGWSDKGPTIGLRIMSVGKFAENVLVSPGLAVLTLALWMQHNDVSSLEGVIGVLRDLVTG